MDRQSAREQLRGCLRDYVEHVTHRSKGTNMYVCPLCGSGTGRNATGAFSIKNDTFWKCFSCNAYGDIFELYGAINNIPDYNQQLAGLCQLYGINLDDYKTPVCKYIHSNIHSNALSLADYEDFFLQAHNHIKNTDYPQKRGLSDEIINRFRLGYVEHWKHPKAPNKPASPRLIIPTGATSYFARDTRVNIPEEQKPYTKSKVGNIQLFNCKALKDAKSPIFVVEGELDALSIIEVGGEAVALGTTTKARAFVELCKTTRPSQPLIIALDNDNAGEKAAEKLVEDLQGLNIPCYKHNPSGQYKDANEALQRNREAFKTAVEYAKHIQDEMEKAKRENYLKNSTAHYLQSFIDDITQAVNVPYISTGFGQLDAALDGGLYEGLYIVGAISSLGKTTIITQIADQIAQSGKDVLIFSLEMARNEIMAKSISRHTLQILLATGGDIKNAKTAREITTGTRYINYNPAEKELISEAIRTYSQYAEHIFINEGTGDVGTEQIRQAIKEHFLCTGTVPVVIIDYLQILAPYSKKATDKQNIDRAVTELKRISRDYKTPVIGISSFNRANYKESVTMESFKESGTIEYSSDVLIGLQLKGAGSKDFDAGEAKKKDPRKIELVILKNRNGKTGHKLSYNFYPMFNYFSESVGPS